MCPQMVEERDAEENGERQMPHRRLRVEGPSGSSGGASLEGGGRGCVGFLDFLGERVDGEEVIVEGTEVKVVVPVRTGGARGGAGTLNTRSIFSK